MKKIILSISAVCILALSPIQTTAKSELPPRVICTKSGGDTTGLYILENRIDEIKALDKSKLSFSEKREIRKELRDINSKLKAMNYIYISVGTLLLIIILVIILL